MQKIIVCLLIICICHSLGLSQIGQPVFRHYTKDQGLPTNNVNEIYQDKTGYIWIATGEGLCRYDGYVYKNYHSINSNSDNNVRFIEQDSTGRIWFATLKNRIYYIVNDLIIPFRHNDKIKKTKGVFHDFKVNKSGTVLCLAMGRTGLIFMDSSGNYSVLPKKNTNSKVIYEYEDFIISSFNNKEDAPDSTIWKPNTIEWHTSAGIKDIIIDKKNLDGAIHIYSAKFGTTGRIVVLGKKVFYFENQMYKWNSQLPVLKGIPFVDSDGSIYIGMLEGNGLRKYKNLEDLRLNRFITILGGKSITWISKDRADGMWVSTIDDGYYYNANSSTFLSEMPENYRAKKMRSLTAGGNGQFFLGLSSGEVAEINPYQGSFSMLPKCPYPSIVQSVYYDQSKTRMYAASNYLQYFENGKWFSTVKQNDRGIPCQMITYRDQNHIFCKTGQYGLLVDKNDLSGKLLKAGDEGLDIRAFAISNDSTVWVSTSKEILCKPKGVKEFRKPDLSNKAFETPAEYFYISRKGEVIFGNSNSFYYFFKNKISKITPKKETFPGNDAKILESPDGKIWMVSGKGCMIYHFYEGGFDEQYIGLNYGLPDEQIFDAAYYDKKLWLATDKGLVTIPDTLYNHALITPSLEYFLVNDSLFSPEKNHLLSYDQNNITITLNTFNYRIAGRNLFRYRLHSKSSWQETSEKQIKLFSLQDGNYPLEIQAKNEEGIWGKSLLIDFSIAPIFYKSWWFLSMIFLLILTIGYAYYRFRINRIEKEGEIKAQITTLERSALQAQMNPHFIFNCLSSIQNFILQNDKSQASLYLSTFAGLVRDTLNTSVDRKVTLEDEIRMLESYLSLEKLRFGNKFNYTLLVADNIDPFDTELPPLIIQPFVENAILHGMKNKKDHGIITVNFEKIGDTIYTTISDNGPGIHTNANAQTLETNTSQSLPKHKSVGLNITKKRLDILSANDKTESYQIHEIKDDDGNVIGTSIRLSFKQL